VAGFNLFSSTVDISTNGNLTDTAGVDVLIFGLTDFRATGFINLADNPGDSWAITGTARLSTPSNISLGQGGSWDSSRLEINANNATVTDINGVTIGNSQIAGNYILSAGGNINVDGTINVNSNWNITTTNAGTITDSNLAVVKILGNANLQSASAITLADTANAAWTIDGTASLATPGNVSLGQGGSWDSSRLEIIANNAIVTDINGVTIGNSQLIGNYILSAGGNINVDGTVNVNGNWTITTTNAGTITDSNLAVVKILVNANLQSAGPITLADTANASWTINGTANLATAENVSLGQGGSWDSSRLEVNANSATVTDINGVTIGNSQLAGNYVLSAGGNINVDGTVNVNGNWNITTTNAGAITDSNAAVVKVLGNTNVQSSGNITLADTANASWTVGGTANLATPGNVSLGQGGLWDSSRFEINANNATVTDSNGVNIGNSQLAGNYGLSAVGNVNVDGTVNVNGNWNVTTTNAGTITDSNAAIVKVLGNANLQSAGAITLADTANASWTIGGTANLATPGNVSLGQGGSWDSSRLEINANNATVTDINGVTIGNSQLAGNYGLSAGGNLIVDGTVNVNGNWNITTTNAGTVTDSNTAVVKILGNTNLQAANAITLADTANASWTIGGTANLAASSNVSLGQGGSWDSSRLEINANNATVTDINGVTIGNSQIAGNYILSAGGNIHVDGTANVNGNWNITTTDAGTITDSNLAVVKVLGNANLQSARAITLADTTNASWTIGGTANLATLGNVNLGQGGAWDSSRLEINANNATVTDTNGVTIGNSQLAGNYILSAGGNINVDGTVNVNGNWNITTTNAGTITDSNSAIIKILGNANLQSASPITLADTTNASWLIGGTANLATPGNVSLGQGGSWDSSRLEINAENSTVIDNNGVTIGNSQIAANYLLSAGGNINVDGTVNVNGNWNITTTNAGTITDSNLAVVKILGNTNLQSAGPITLADTANAAWTIGGIANLATSGNVSLGQGGFWDSSRLEVNANNATVTDINGVTIGNSQVTGNYLLNAGGNINVDGTVNVNGNWNITTTNSGTITDSNAAIVKILGNTNLQAANAITLADTASAAWTINGTANLSTPGNVSLGQGGSWDSSRLEINANNATVTDIHGVTIGNSQLGGNYILSAGGNIHIDGAVNIDGNWNITTTNIGTITDSNLAVVNIRGNAILQSAGAVTLADTANASWTIGGTANLAAPGNMSLGQGGLWDSRQLSIDAANANVSDLTGVTLADHHIAGNYRLTAGGTIDSTTLAAITIGGSLWMTGESVDLAESVSNQLQVAGSAFFNAPNGQVRVGSAGTVQFGSLGLKANIADISEDSQTFLDGVNVNGLKLQSREIISQSGIDTGAGIQGVVVRGDAVFGFEGATGSVRLIRTGLSSGTELADGMLMDNSIAGLVSANNLNGDFLLRNVAASPSLGTLQGAIHSLTLWQPLAGLTLSPNFHQVGRDLTIIVGMDVVANASAGISHNIGLHADWKFLTNASANLIDQDASVRVDGNAMLLAGGAIQLADRAGEQFHVPSGQLSVVSLGGGRIELGGAGAWQSQSLGIASENIQTGILGNMTIISSGNIQLANPVLPTPGTATLAIRGSNLSMTISGGLTNSPGLIISLGNNLTIDARDAVSLVTDSASELRVLGSTNIRSQTSNVEFGTSGQVITGTIRAVAEQGDIALGNSQARMGELSLVSNGISVREGDNTVLATAIALRQLDIDSTGSITNTQTSNSTARTGIATPQANLRAGTFIHLADTEIQRVNALARSNGTLGDPKFFQLNAQADRTGQAYLNAIGTNISPNAQTSPRLISGESLADLQRNASYIQTIGRQYGIYLKNLGALEVQQMTSFGRGTNLFVETGRGQDLRVTHSIEQVFDNGQAGKMVLIAGGSLIMAPSAEIQVIDVSGNPNTARIALQPQFEASAFNGGKGPQPGFQSTQTVLYASDTQADNGIQNVLQRVSTQFGVAGERGFQILIQYADGRLQMFDVASEIYASLIHGEVGTNPSGTIQSHGGAGDAAVVQRAIPFTDIFLASNVMLPTTAIFRRSSELFLFENAGQADLSLKTVDLTPAIDLVEDVLAPGRRVSLPMSSEIRVTPQLMNMEVRPIPTLEQIYTLVDNSTPVKSITPKIVEVMIVRVGFDDVNEDGQPDPSEIPNRDDIQLKMLDNQIDLVDSANAPGLGTSRKKLAPGEIDVVSKDVKESVSPTSADLQRWVDEYRSDPLKPSGVYAIISKDPSIGTKVLKVFSIRDFDVDGSNAEQLDQDRGLIESSERSPQQDASEQPDAPENKK
jgi:ribosomal protein L15